MKKQTAQMTAAFLMLIATLGSCQKGDTGATGAAGQNGTNGTNGTNGNANVVAGSLTVDPSNWTWNTANDWYVCAVTDSAVNADIVSSGSVLAFLQNIAYENWYALPYSFADNSTVSIYFAYNYFLYTVNLTFQFSNQAQASSIATYNYKIVCITSEQRKANPNTNWNDYNSIKAALGNNLVEKTIAVKH